jgi:type II secretory pathway predicted ATPase ExeA
VSRLAPAAAEPFADDAAGADYFATDYHHRFLVNAIREQLAKARGFVLVSGDPPADGEMLSRYLTDEKETGYRVALVRCRTGMVFDDLVRAYSRQLGLRADDDSARLWALLSHLMLETRNGITRILIVENADALDIRTFDELHRFARLDDPHLMSVVLLAAPGFAQRLDTAPLNFLKPAIVGHVPAQQLHAEEVGAFIHYQLNTVAPNRALMLSSDDIAAIATAANGNPGAVNRLARQALAAKKAPPSTPEPVVLPSPLPEPLVAKPIPTAAPKMPPTLPEPLVAKPISTPAPKLPAAALPLAPKPLPAMKLLAPEPAPPAATEPATSPEPVPAAATAPAKPLVPPATATPAKPLVPAATTTPAKPPVPVGAVRSPAGEPVAEDPIPDIPLVLPAAALPVPDRSDAVASAARTIRAARVPAPPPAPRKTPAEGEHVVKPLAAKPLADMPAVPLAPAASDDDANLDDEAVPLPLERRPRPQMASGVAAVIYLAAVVLSGALLLYIFDPGLRRDQVPLLSATATIPPPPSEPVATVQPVATAPVPEPPVETAARTTAAAGAPPAPVAADQPAAAPAPVMAASEPPLSPLAPSKEPAADAKPPVAKGTETPPPPTLSATAAITTSPAAAEPPTEADTRSAASVEPAAPPPRATALAAAEPATKAALPSDPRPVEALSTKLVPAPRESGTVVTVAPPVSNFERPPAAELAVLVRRGDEFLTAGDIISARNFFDRAAKSGDAGGALGLGKSYDPLYLRQAGVRGVAGDPAKAANWYRTAATAGNAEAALRLKRLQAAYPPQ